ncbi:MAG: EpsG family protein, partial [Faecousia sp.]
RLVYYGAGAFLLLIFVTQDFSVSVDMPEYMRQYAIIPGLSFGEMLVHKFEIGYVLLCWILERIFVSNRVLLLVLGVMILLPYCISFEKETEAPMVALMAFLALGMYMHAVIYWRQLVAMAILTFSYRFIRERKFVPFLLVVLLAMTFHKTAIVYLGLYVLYNIPINAKLLIAFGIVSAILGIFGRPIIEFGIAVIYPRYTNFTRESEGGETLLALLWVITLLSYWLFRDRMDDGRIRLPFLMILIAAAIQPICFAFYNWLRIVLYFRVALVPMTAQLYVALFEQKENNKALALLARFTPGLHRAVLTVYDKRWFRIAMQLCLFAVLFVWYVSELDGAFYRMAPIA